MFNIVFVFMVIIFSVVHSLQAMDPFSNSTMSQRKASSLKNLCREVIAKNIQSPEEVEKFARGETKYYLLPEEEQNKIAKKLPGRPHRQCRIHQSSQVEKVISNKKLSQCMILSKNGLVSLANVTNGDIFYSFNAPEAKDIVLSPDGNTYFLHCKDNFSNYKWYGEICFFKENDFIRYHIDNCFTASFSPTGNQLVVQKPNGLSLWDIDSCVTKHDDCQHIQFCSTGKRLFIKKNNIARVIDTSNDKELLQESMIRWAFLSSNGKKLLMYKGNGLSISDGKLVDIDLGLVKHNFFYTRSVGNPFDADSNYLLLLYQNQYDLFDAQSGHKIVSFSIDNMMVEFVLGGKYLFFKSVPEISHRCKYGCVVSVEDLIGYVAENKKDTLKIEDIPKKIETPDCHNLFFPAVGNYLVHHLDGQIWVIDLLDNKSVFLAEKTERFFFSECGQMLILQRKSKGNKYFLNIIRFDNDLTIEQFLLKHYSMAYGMTEERLMADAHLCNVYNSLSSKQKNYFIKHVFKKL